MRWWGECIRGFSLGFTNPVGTGGMWDVCLCLGCVDCVGAWTRVCKGGVVLYLCGW